MTDCPIANIDNIAVIVGAGRSGTTILKELIGSHHVFAPTEFELNHLWRYGNSSLSHDFLDPNKHLNFQITSYIQTELEKERQRSGKPRLVEKTVANVARVSFVAKVLPNAKIIHLVRDGRAVSASAIKRWQAKPSSGYLLRKSTTVPITDVPRVAFRYFGSTLKALLRRRNYRQSWGPRWESIDQDVRDLSLSRICARQWKLCVESALQQGRALPSQRYLEIRYEALVSQPKQAAHNVADFLGISASDPAYANFYENKLSDRSLHKWQTRLSRDQISEIEEEAGPLLKNLEYLK